MPVALTCPKCQAPQTVPDDAAGQTVRCPACQAEYPAGAAAPPARPPAKRSALPWVIGQVLLAGLAVFLFLSRPIPTDYTDPDGVFSARFPNRPEVKTLSEAQPLMLLWGERLARARVWWWWESSVTVVDGLNAGDELYGPATRDAHITGVAVVTVTNDGGKQLTERPATHEGHPAREVAYLREDGWLTALRVLAGERYALRMAVTGNGDRNNPAGFLDRAREFFDAVHVGPGLGPPIVGAPPAVTAADLAAAYKADAQAADAKYRGRWLRVTGRVSEVREDGAELVLGEVVVRRAARARRTVPVRGPGAEVVLTGKCRGLSSPGEAVVLEEAIVANPQAK